MKNIICVFVLLFSTTFLEGQTLFHPHFGEELCGNHITKIKQREAIAHNISFASFDPPVIFSHQKFNLILGTDLKNVNHILLKNEIPSLWQNNKKADTIKLADDGKNGDKVAGDNLFSFDGLTLSFNSSQISGQHFPSISVTFMMNDGTRLSQSNIPITFGLRVKPNSYTQLPTIKKISDKIQHTEYVLNIVADAQTELSTLTKEYYNYFPDDRDFLALAHTNMTEAIAGNVGSSAGVVAAQFYAVKQNFSGVQAKSFNTNYDNSKTFGSNGVLKGLIKHYSVFGGENLYMTHELLHYWASFLDASFDISGLTHYKSSLLGTSGFGGHEGNIKVLSDTTILLKYGAASNYYSPLELYLMGAQSIDSIYFPIVVYLKESFISTADSGFLFKYKGKNEITKQEFLDKMGPRTPAILHSQKSFKLGFIVTSSRLLLPEELSYFENKLKEHEFTYLPNDCNQPNAPFFQFKSCSNNNFNTASNNKLNLTTRIHNTITPVHNSIPENEVDLFPNPANGYIKIKSNTNSSTWKYTLYDFLGRVVQKGNVHMDVILLNEKFKGIYMVSLEKNNLEVYNKKILIN